MDISNIVRLLGDAVIGAAIAGLFASVAYADVVVIVSSNSPISTLSVEQVAEIFLGKSNNLPGWGEVVPIDQAEGSHVRNEFYAKTTGKSPSLLKAYWSKLIFTGEGQPPREVANNVALKKLIADNLNLIGYVDRNSVDGSVKIVLQPGSSGAR